MADLISVKADVINHYCKAISNRIRRLVFALTQRPEMQSCMSCHILSRWLLYSYRTPDAFPSHGGKWNHRSCLDVCEASWTLLTLRSCCDVKDRPCDSAVASVTVLTHENKWKHRTFYPDTNHFCMLTVRSRSLRWRIWKSFCINYLNTHIC